MRQFLRYFVLFAVLGNGSLCHAQNKYVDSLKTVLASRTKPIERFDIINQIEWGCSISGNGETDSSYVMQMLDIALQLKSDSLKAISFDWIGDYFQTTNIDYSKALDFLLKGVPLAEKANDKFTLSQLYSEIGNVYVALNIPAEVLNYVKKEEETLPDKNAPGYYVALRQMDYCFGNYYWLIQKRPDSELHYMQAVNDINSFEKSPFWEALAVDGIGLAYGDLGDTILSETYIKKAIELAKLNNSYFTLCFFKTDLAEELIKRKKFEDAKEQAGQCFVICKQHKYYWQLKIAADQLKTIYDKQHKTDSAYYYLQIESAIKDSVFSQEKMNKVQAMAFSEQIRIKEEHAKKAEEQEQQKQNVQYALIAIGIISFIILFLLLSRSFITNTKMIQLLGVMALLIVFEFLNLLLHPFLERVTHHTPLLMLLALVCIAALLVPLHHRLEKWATHKLVEKNKQIRLAAAKKTIEKLENDKTIIGKE